MKNLGTALAIFLLSGAVAQRLGHSTPMITLTTYGHVLKRAEEHAAAVSGSLLERVLGGMNGA